MKVRRGGMAMVTVLMMVMGMDTIRVGIRVMNPTPPIPSSHQPCTLPITIPYDT